VDETETFKLHFVEVIRYKILYLIPHLNCFMCPRGNPMDDTSNRQKPFQLEPWNRGISDEEILADIRHVTQSLKLSTLKYWDYDKHGRVRARTVELRFGSWNDALSKAGL